jgi:hypothetical protein
MTDDFHESDTLNRDKVRRRKQKGYQAGYRRRLKCGRVPDRGDMAAACLRRVLAAWANRPDAGQDLRQAVLDDLTGRFSREQAERVLDAMIHRTRKTRQQRRA